MHHKNKSACIFNQLKHIQATENCKQTNNKTNHLKPAPAAIQQKR